MASSLFIFFAALVATGYTAIIDYNQHFKEFESVQAYKDHYGETDSMGVRVNMTHAMNQDSAVCIDGSVPVFYYRPGRGDGVNKFHIFFQGGGWCAGNDEAIADPNTMDTCQHRATTDFGSSLGYAATANYDYAYMATSQATNPVAYNWNTIWVKYCDGGSFSGNNDTVLKGDIDLHFRGWPILNGVFHELTKRYNFSDATDVLMSGASAGGLAVWLHADYVYDEWVKPLGANFLAMPDSGFFLQYEGTGKYVTGLNWVYQYQNASASMNVECMQKHDEDDKHLCMFAQQTAPYVHVKMFPLQSRFDSWQTDCELESKNPKVINEYGTNFTQIFEATYLNGTQYKEQHAAWLESCYHHCWNFDTIVIDNFYPYQAQFEVYYGNLTHSKFWFQEEVYPCSTCCGN